MRSRAGLPVSPWWIIRLSPTCFSMVWSGLSEVIGSWNTKLMSLPRTCISSRWLAPTIWRPW